MISYLLFAIAAAIIIFYILKPGPYSVRIITTAAITSLLLNFVLNFHFYPNLLGYQAGSSMAQIVKDQNIPKDSIYKLSDEHTWSLDFYNQKPVNRITLEDLVDADALWVYASDEELQTLKDHGFDWNKQHTVIDFRITRLQAKFLNPATRQKTLRNKHLVHIFK
jgi:hypothetical protein